MGIWFSRLVAVEPGVQPSARTGTRAMRTLWRRRTCFLPTRTFNAPIQTRLYSAEPLPLPYQGKLRPLFVDGLNVANSFFSPTHHWHLPIAHHKIKKFVAACRGAGYEPTIFMDAGARTSDAAAKARRRTAKNIRALMRRNPMGLQAMMGDMFKECNVDVRYAVEAECDHTLASWAVMEGADVLSQDKDYYRYRWRGEPAPIVNIYESYLVQGGFLSLIPSSPPVRRRPPLELLDPPPSFSTDYYASTIKELRENSVFRRGAPTSLMRILGTNPHLDALPLRAAWYARLFGRNSNRAITEVFPIWDPQTSNVFYTSHRVVPDPAHDSLLDKPAEAVEFLFRPDRLTAERPDEVSPLAWSNHIFALHAVTFELCSMASGRSMWEIFRYTVDLPNRGRAQNGLEAW